MTEASYTAWDDKQYVWPPPDGWYQAPDEKWWPEGYGPQPAEPAADAPATEITETTAETVAPNDLVDRISEADFESNTDAVGDAAESSVLSDAASGLGNAASGVDDAASGLGDTASSFGESASGVTESFGNAADGLGDTASELGDTALGLGGGLGENASGLTDAASGFGDHASGFGDRVSGFADDVPGADDLLPDGVEDRLGISDDDGMPTSDIGELGGLDGLTQRVSDFGEVSTPDLGDLPSPGLNDLPAPGLDGLADVGDLPGAADDIPSIQDLASPDLDLSSLPSGSGLDEDMTQVVPTNIGGQFSDPLPPPPGSGPTFDAPAPGLDDLPAPDVGLPTFDAGSIDPPSFDAPKVDAPQVDAPDFDLPTFDPSGIEPPIFDAPTIAAPQVDVSSFGAQAAGHVDPGMAPPAPNPAIGDVPPPGQVPPAGQPQQFGTPGYGQAAAPPVGLQQEILASNKGGGRGKTLLFVVLGVLALAAIGALLFWQFGRDNGDGDSAAAATGPGSVGQPHPRTTGVVVFYPDGDTDQRWVIEVLDPVSTGGGELAAGSEDGDVFAVTRVSVRYESGADGASIGDLRFNAVNGAGELIDRQDNQCPSTADDLDYNAAVAVGAEVIGAVCWEVPASDLSGLKLGLESEKVAGRVHIALQ